MHKILIHTLTIAAFSLSLIGAACNGSGSGGGGTGTGGGACAAALFFVEGTWISSFRCGDTSFSCFGDSDVIELTQDGDAANPGSNVSFTDNNGGSFSGTLCGDTFTWSGNGAGFVEEGTWTFAGADSFSKTTAYTRDDGTGGGCCTGDGVREGNPPPPIPATCPANTCAKP